jgi:hypothetical protein
MLAIQHICWATIPPTYDRDLVPTFAEQGSHLFAFWPSPIEPDACFEQAGFSEFYSDLDTDDWDVEWSAIIESLLGHVERFGPLRLRNQADVFEYLPQSFFERCLFWRPLSARSLSPSVLERLHLSTEDDRYPPAVVTVGEPPDCQIHTSRGHPILWVDAVSALSLEPSTIAQAIAAGRPIEQYDLAWQHLF